MPDKKKSPEEQEEERRKKLVADDVDWTEWAIDNPLARLKDTPQGEIPAVPRQDPPSSPPEPPKKKK